VTPTELAARLAAVLASVTGQGADGPTGAADEAVSVAAGGAYGRVCLDVPPEHWAATAAAVRDDPALGLTFFDVLGAVDEAPEGFAVVVHLWSVPRRHGALLRTRLPRDRARVPSLTGVFGGAAWHEREAYEMFGIVFDGHPDLKPLLLPEGFEGHPLRKDFVLASRVVKPWPGAKEPGESEHGTPARRKARPPGVPDPAVWGPEA